MGPRQRKWVRWLTALQEYNIQTHYINGNDNHLADRLSRLAEVYDPPCLQPGCLQCCRNGLIE
jgi:hypothetical protein